ncbi:hypothetical protein JOC75_004428 [Metabacillus crassostreae]|uniref:SGNH/GDSL hydrolase family protein n=1 Tax=Metabacillus crassostreae TaxID=929098 RepID=UPI001957FA4D|nr:hypothetical protein [Metabacillus crassostreae]MBM7606380.1 hypothetical protein [Metabacillus crassostreae]
MKKFFVILTIIICAAAIIVGNLHWKNKITAHSKVVANTEKVNSETQVVEEEKVEIITIDVTSYAARLPESVQNKIKTAQSTGKPLNLVIYGSDATSDQAGAWPSQLKAELESTYGTEIFKVTIISEGNQTTLDVVQERSYEEVTELKPDIVLFEPFMLKDNSGLIGFPNTIANIETMMESWKSTNESVTIMMQPPNPLFSADYYPKEVIQLQDYAEANDIIYLNHWEAWPDLEDIKMKSYLTEKNDVNEDGNNLWANYLIEYFIQK